MGRLTHLLQDVNNFKHGKKFLEDYQTSISSSIIFFYQFMKINEIALNALHLELYIFQVNYFVTFSF